MSTTSPSLCPCPALVRLLPVLLLALFDPIGLQAQSPPDATVADPAVAAAERALSFLQTDAAAWRAERQCATCHHGLMTVCALGEAQAQGYDVAPDVLADTLAWTKERLDRIDLPRDERPGWSMVNTPAMYLALMSRTIPDQSILSEDELRRIAGHLLRHQEADGSWAWSSAPPVNRPPPFFESDELATLLAGAALRADFAPDAELAEQIAQAETHAAEWLAQAATEESTQLSAVRLLVGSLAGHTADELKPEIERLLAARNADGGWGQLPNRESDAFATGQVLYVLNVAGVPAASPEIQDAVNFLVRTQLENGSWPMKRRGHPGVTPSENVVPITYFGSAWGTLGLVRSVPKRE